MITHVLKDSKSICGNVVSVEIHYYINSEPVITSIKVTIQFRGEVVIGFKEIPYNFQSYVNEYHDKLLTHAADDIEKLKSIEIANHQSWLHEDKQLMMQSIGMSESVLIDEHDRMNQLIEIHMARGDTEAIATEKASKIIQQESQFDDD